MQLLILCAPVWFRSSRFEINLRAALFASPKIAVSTFATLMIWVALADELKYHATSHVVL